MSFEIKNLADATYGAQAEVDNVDVDILVQGIKGEGVVTGCAVTQRAAGANMSVDVASGTVRIAGASVAVASGNVAVSAADASNPRFDLVVVNNAGAKSVVAGTAAATAEFPEVPANSVALAAVYVPAAASSVATAQITDKRVNVSAGAGALDDLTDVDTTSTPPADGDRLTYDSASSLWKPAAPGAAMINFDDLGDVDLTTTPPADGDTVVYDSASGLWVPAASPGASGSADHAWYVYEAAMLEPLAIEQLRSGAFSYAIGAAETKLVVNAFNTRLGSAGRWEVRDPRRPMPLRGVTVTGLGASAVGVFIDPTLPSYADARTKYLDRLNTLATTAPKYLSLSATGSTPFLPGPYGSIITSVNVFDATWLICRPYGTSLGWNLHDENGDAAAEAVRSAHPALIPVSKRVAALLELGTQRSGGDAEGSITYLICPASWGAVTDGTTYAFRDDFLGASLDTATKWTRSQSTAGNIEIDTAFGWLKVVGNGAWGTNGAHSQTGRARASSAQLIVDVFTGSAAAGSTPDMVGLSDGAGVSYTNLAHAINFADTSGSGAFNLKAYELGTDRGIVGSGWSPNTIYRVRITAQPAGGATYEIQGGSEYPAIGGASWTTITPGTTTGATATLYAGIAKFTTLTVWVGDVRLI